MAKKYGREKWAVIEGTNGMYKISNYGKIYSEHRQRLLSPSMDAFGYLVVALPINGKKRNYYVHRLVATYFVPNKSGFRYVRHKDGNKFNNCFFNLEWYERSRKKVV